MTFFNEIVDRNLKDFRLWKFILREMVEVLIARLPEDEQLRSVSREEMTNIITLRRIIHLPHAEAHTWIQWYDVFCVGFPRASWVFWYDFLRYLFDKVSEDELILIDYWQTRKTIFPKEVIRIRTICTEDFYEYRRLRAESTYNFTCSDPIESVGEADEFLEQHQCQITESAKIQLAEIIETDAELYCIHLDITNFAVFVQLYDIVDEIQ